MNKSVSITSLILIVVALAASPQIGLAHAQQQQPLPREDNMWGGLSHQPTEPEVLQQEQAAGIAAPPQQQKAVNENVEQMYQSLMKGTAPPGSAGSQ